MAANPTTAKIGHGLAKVLGIKLNYRNPTGEDVTRGESVFSVSTADTYVEEEPSSLEWISETAPSGRTFKNWFLSLFPFTHWILRYNSTWLISDLVAGEWPFHRILDGPGLPFVNRYHRRGCRRASVHGVREIGTARSPIWSLLFIHGCFDLLVLRNIQGYHNRGL